MHRIGGVNATGCAMLLRRCQQPDLPPQQVLFRSSLVVPRALHSRGDNPRAAGFRPHPFLAGPFSSLRRALKLSEAQRHIPPLCNLFAQANKRTMEEEG